MIIMSLRHNVWRYQTQDCKPWGYRLRLTGSDSKFILNDQKGLHFTDNKTTWFDSIIVAKATIQAVANRLFNFCQNIIPVYYNGIKLGC
jgi:hypothetical protein